MARPRRGRGPVHHPSQYHRSMKKLIAILAIVAIGAIVYKVLTTEVPIDEI